MGVLLQQLDAWRRTVVVVPNLSRTVSSRALRLFVVAGFALTLAGCDKCNMPVWRHDTPAAPQSCHDDAPAQQ
jgi:hypothetical protein